MLTPVLTADAVTAFWELEFPQVGAEGMTLLSVAPGAATMRLDPDRSHLRPGGTVSGPALFALADVAAYAVLLAHVGAEPLIVTTNLNISFLRRPPFAPLVAEAHILKLGRRLATVAAGIQPAAGGELVAHATGTYAIPSKVI